VTIPNFVRFITVAPALALSLTACSEVAPAFGPNTPGARQNAEEFFYSVGSRFTNIQRPPRILHARAQFGHYALTPSGIYNDTSVWLAIGPDSARLFGDERRRPVAQTCLVGGHACLTRKAAGNPQEASAVAEATTTTEADSMAQTVGDYVQALRDFEPALLCAYPTSLECLCRFMQQQGLDVNVPHVLTSSEVLKRDGPKVFKSGTHVYLNHPTAAEEAQRPLPQLLGPPHVVHRALAVHVRLERDNAVDVGEGEPGVGHGPLDRLQLQ